MSEHVNEWLSPYFDGELRGMRLSQVESHLAECGKCQTELERVRELSALLRGTTLADEFISTERFISNLTLTLPRQTEKPQTRKVLEIGCWLVPVTILGTWAFIQVTFLLSSLVQTASDAGLLGSTFASLQGNPSQTEWFTTLTGFFGVQPGSAFQIILSQLNSLDLFIQSLAGQFIWQALLGVIYLSWLAAWWFRQQNNNLNVQTGSVVR
jgi:predicted anti-sigma-YlaC factor YlaD